VLGKSEYARKPSDRLGKVLILDVGQYNVGRHGTVLKHSLILKEIFIGNWQTETLKSAEKLAKW
jgi:hypothetical protein